MVKAYETNSLPCLRGRGGWGPARPKTKLWIAWNQTIVVWSWASRIQPIER